MPYHAAGNGAASPAAIVGADRWPASARPMGFGVLLRVAEGSALGPTPHFRDILEMTRVAHDVGFDAVWIIDHLDLRLEPDNNFQLTAHEDERGGWECFSIIASLDTPTVRIEFQMPADEDERGGWECFTVMAGLASATERIQIGSLVACTGFRNPGLVAKMTETIDDISGGRVILGLGAGWHEPEYDAFGYPFDHRVSRFEEALAIIQPLLRGEHVDFQGEFFQARDAVNRPRGPRPTGAPILVGSSGHRMLRITARYADAWNTVWHKDPQAVAPLMATVDEACREIGRDPATLVRTAGGNIAMSGYLGERPDPIEGDAETMAETILGFRDLGIQHFVAGLDPCTPQSIEEFARVIELIDAAK
jgi:alkanesulfonate monooxygenase SsuD/methylene tetrahydromethanopterin reductase-like flavin-dependent oxidoreductase (luciferase family)